MKSDNEFLEGLDGFDKEYATGKIEPSLAVMAMKWFCYVGFAFTSFVGVAMFAALGTAGLLYNPLSIKLVLAATTAYAFSLAFAAGAIWWLKKNARIDRMHRESVKAARIARQGD